MVSREKKSYQSNQNLNVPRVGFLYSKSTETASREIEERHQTILEIIEEGYSEVDLKGRVVFCNDSVCRIYGYPREELIGMDYQVYMDEATSVAVFETFNEVFRTRVPNKGFAYEIIRKNGEKRIVEVSISLVKNQEGHRVGFRHIIRDITDRKRIEAELEKHHSQLQAIFRSVRDAIITVDTEMVVVEANKAAENICGLDPEKIKGKVLTTCSTHCNKNCHEVFKEGLRSQIIIKEYQIECSHSQRPQQSVIVSSSPLMSRDDKFMGSVITIRDITKLSDLENELRERHQFQKIIGKSSKMQEIYVLLNDLTNLDTTVLITGESGTGKSLAGKALHYSGRRALKPLITVNCSALTENLLESELFGHVKGAFTGATNDVHGRFRTAGDGTILLEEIGDISPRIQLKLLRVLEEKEFERVGDSVPIKMNARIITCTNQELKEKVRLGYFREDLYYRLKIVEVKMPPLRSRLEDIPLLVEHFCDDFNKKFQKNIRGLSDEVFNIFLRYHWPGNIRELSHSLEHAFVLCRNSTISIEHLPAEIREYSGSKTSSHKKKSGEGKEKLIAVLEKTDWNKAKAARLLGIDRSTLYRKIIKYQLSKKP